MTPVTRREKLLAKLRWPEIDTQRTRFVRATNSAPVLPAPELGIEHVELEKSVYHGKHKHAAARWGYSRKLDTVVIRYVRTAHNWAIDCEDCWPKREVVYHEETPPPDDYSYSEYE